MGARGPAKRPAGLRLLNGTTEGRDSGGRAVVPPPPFKRQAPHPPSWLDREAMAEWRRVVPGLERLDVLKPEDRAALSVYCVTWSRYVAAVRLYHRDGMTLVNPDSGRVYAHPAVGIAHTAGAQLLRYAQEFGLTASAEQRLSAPAPDDDSDGNNPFS